MKIKKKHVVILVIVLAVAGLVGFGIARGRNPQIEYSTYIAERQKLVQEVSATGSVKPSAEFNLGFKTSGKISAVHVEVGDEVKKGDILAELESSELSIGVRKAEAALNLAKANLYLEMAGETAESIDYYEKKVEEAQAALDASEKSLEDAKENLDNVKASTAKEVRNAELSLAASEDSLANTQAEDEQAVSQAYESANTTMEGNLVTIATAMTDMDNILGVDNSTANDTFESYLGVLSYSAKATAEDAYESAKERKNEAQSAVVGISIDSDTDAAIAIVKAALKSADNALEKTMALLDNSIADASSSFTQAVLATKKSTINTDRSSVNTAIIALETKQQAIATAKLARASAYDTARNARDQAEHALGQAEVSAKKQVDAAQASVNSAETAVRVKEASLASAQATLALKKADPREVDLASLRAKVADAEASLELAKTQRADAALLVPVDGVVTDIAFEAGEQTSVNQAVVSMLGNDKFQIEMDISESDIAKVSVDNKAEITLDAFGEDRKFAGKVVFIEPAETVISGVIYYRIKVQIEEAGDDVKSGMTANVIITTREKDGVLVVPARSLEYVNGTRLVRILVDGQEIEREVKVGMKGNGGMIEITEGLEGGEEVITFKKENR